MLMEIQHFLLASSFIGKDVELSEKDSSDNYYIGKVTTAFKENGLIKVKVKLKDSDEEISVTIDKISKVGVFENKDDSQDDSKNNIEKNE